MYIIINLYKKITEYFFLFCLTDKVYWSIYVWIITETQWNVNIDFAQFELQTIIMGGSRILRGVGRIGGPHSPFSKKIIPWTPFRISGSARDFLIYIKGSNDHVRCVNLLAVTTQRQCKENVLTSLKVQKSKAFKAFVIIMIYFVCLCTHRFCL